MFFKAKIIYALVLFCIFISSMELIEEEEPNDENNKIKVINLTEISNVIELNKTSPKRFKVYNNFWRFKFEDKNISEKFLVIRRVYNNTKINKYSYLSVDVEKMPYPEIIRGNVLALPAFYYEFYFQIYNFDFDYNQTYSLSFVDNITLYEGEKFSLYTEYIDFNFTIQYIKINSNESEKHAFITKDLKNVEMSIGNRNGNDIPINGYGIIEEINETITNIGIRIIGGDCFSFIGHSLNINNTPIYTGEQVQYYYLIKNKKICLDIESLQENDRNFYELMISQKKNMDVYINNAIHTFDTIIIDVSSNVCINLTENEFITSFQLKLYKGNSYNPIHREYYNNYYRLQKKYNIEKIHYLGSEQKKSYSFNISYSSYIIDLIVLTGDACIDGIEVNNNLWNKDLKMIGNNQRLIINYLSDSNNNSDEGILYFNIKANKEGAVYRILLRKKDIENIWPMSLCCIESFRSETEEKFIYFIPEHYVSEDENIGIFINLINCNYQITFFKITKFELGIEERNYLIKEYLSTDDINENDDCLMYVGASYLNQNNHYMTLPEGNSLKFKLSKEITIIRTNFYYAYSLVNPELYIRVNIYKSNIPIILSIIIDDINYKSEYELIKTKNILVFDSDKATNELKLKKDNLYEIKFIFEISEQEQKNNQYMYEYKESIFDINIKTSNKYPILIKSKEVVSDIIINNEKNNINYYYSHIPWNSYGYIKLNFNWGSGYLFGKLINLISQEEGGLINKIILPDENSRSKLEFDAQEQKIFFRQSDTSGCGKHCYLVVGVKSNNNYISDGRVNNINYELFSEYTIIYRFFENIINLNINYMDIQNNQLIFNSLSYKNKYEYYKYVFQEDEEKVLFIEFKSDNCLLEVLYNNKIINTYISNGENIIDEIKKPKIVLSEDSLFLLIKEIDGDNMDITSVNMHFKIKIFEPNNFLKDISTIDSNHPVYCKPKLMEDNLFYCNYLLTLNNIYIQNTIVEIIAQELGQTNNKPELYLNILNSDDYLQSVKENKILKWPDKKNNIYLPLKKENNFSNNYIYLPIKDYFEKNKKSVNGNTIDLLLLFTVSTRINSSIELNTYIHNDIKNNTLAIFPIFNEYQFFSCYMNNTLKINISNNDNYYLQILSIDENAMMTMDNKSQKIEKGIILNNIKNKIIDIRSYYHEQDSYYKFYLFYKKNLKDNYLFKTENVEQIKAISGFKFINKRNLPITYLINITNTNITENLYFYIYLSNLTSSNTTKESYNDNFTEYLLIKVKLVNEAQLISEKSDKNKDNKEEFFGNYDVIYHGGRIIVPHKNISEFKKKFKGKSIYLKIKIKNQGENRRMYQYIKGNIFLIKDKYIRENIPKSTFITNVFEAGKDRNNKEIKHIYKLDELIDSDINRTKIVYFSTISKDVSFYLTKDLTDEKKYLISFNYIKKMDETGQDEIYFNDKTKDVYLIVKCKPKNYNIEYSFKYYTKNTKYEIKPIMYNNKISNIKTSDYSTSLNLKINKIPNNQTLKINYYIRIYEDENLPFGDLDISTSFRTVIPYSMHKVKYDDPILNSNENYFELNLKTNVYGKYFIDAIAELLFDEENQITDYYAYKKLYPTSNEDKSKESIIEKILIIVSITVGAILLIIIFILIIVILKYRKRHLTLEKKVRQISFSEENQFDEDDI